MAGKDATPDRDHIPSADEMRMALVEKQMEEVEKREKAKAAEEKSLADFADVFLTQHVTQAEREMVRRIAMNAMKDGKLEAMVYSFPSDLCTDGGRAINNMDPNWPDTLQGKAKELYERFQTIAKPKGYKLKAMIISFPGGVPGDVGFFLNWGVAKRPASLRIVPGKFPSRGPPWPRIASGGSPIARWIPALGLAALL